VLEPGDDGHLKKSPKQRHLTMMSFGASAVPVRSCVLSALSGKVDHGCVHDSLPTGALIVLAMRMFADMVVSTPRLTRSSWRREHGPCAELDVDAVIAEGGSAQLRLIRCVRAGATQMRLRRAPPIWNMLGAIVGTPSHTRPRGHPDLREEGNRARNRSAERTRS